MNLIEKYYNKFNEDKRLLSRHGQVEFAVTMKYIKQYLKDYEVADVIDIGAGTGRYSVALCELGHNVTAVELVLHNLRVLESKNSKVQAILGNAMNLKKIKDNSFDITLLLGPLYHLFTLEDKLKALKEAKRVTKSGGKIFCAFYMNDYAVISYGFKDGNIKECLKQNMLDENFKVKDNEQNLYSMVRLEDIEKLEELSNLKREKIVGVDGATDYIRPYLNKFDDETFDLFIKYQLSICERKELLGASSHILDILSVEK